MKPKKKRKEKRKNKKSGKKEKRYNMIKIPQQYYILEAKQNFACL